MNASQPSPDRTSQGSSSRRAFLLAAGGLGVSAVVPDPASANAPGTPPPAAVSEREVVVPQQSVPVEHVCDVLVCGGGCSGVAAAVAAARHGAKVILVERWPSVGGMATNALVTGWHRSDRTKVVINGLVEESAVRAEKQPDAVGHGVWMIDIHDPKGSGYTTYTDRNRRTMLAEGASYHIPLGMCLNAQVPNLGVVGRCASATHEALASCRVQTHCMVMGQGVGTCAALALQAGVDLAQVDVAKLQAALRADGVYLEDVPGA